MTDGSNVWFHVPMVDVSMRTLTAIGTYQEMWFLHCQHHLGKKPQTKRVTIEYYFYGCIIPLVNEINREGISTGN